MSKSFTVLVADLVNRKAGKNGLADGVRISHFCQASLLKFEGTGYYHCMSRIIEKRFIIGSRAFVEDIFLSSRDWFGSRRKTGARAMRNAKDIGLVSMRDLQLSPISSLIGDCLSN